MSMSTYDNDIGHSTDLGPFSVFPFFDPGNFTTSIQGVPEKADTNVCVHNLKTYFMHVFVTMISYSHVLFKVVATNPRSIDQILFKI